MTEIVLGILFSLAFLWMAGAMATALRPHWGWMLASIGSILLTTGIIILLVQLFSLAVWLTPLGLALGSLGAALLIQFACRRIAKNANPLDGFRDFPQAIKSWLQATFTWPACAMGGVLLACMLLLLYFGLEIHPIGDSYHFTRPLYWLQHGTIAPFPAANYRINALAPGSDILSLPLLMYFGISSTRVLMAPICLLMLVPLIQRLCVQLGATPRAGLLAALVCTSGSILLNSILYGWSDILLPGVCLATSVVLLMASRKEEGKLDPLNLGFSVLFLIMAVGFKNLLAFATPGYALILLATHGWRWLLPRGLVVGASGALAGVILSAFAWNYTSNLIHYGRLTGPPALASDSLATLNVPDVSTRVARGLIQVLDVTYTPGFLEKGHRDFKSRLSDLLGASRVLEGESPSGDRRFDSQDTQDRKGFGWPGLLLVIGTGWGLAAHLLRPSMLRRVESRQALALLALLLIHFILVHGLVVWMDYGRLRFAAPLLFVLAPAIAPLLGRRWLRNLVAAIIVMHTGLLVLKSAVVTYRYKESAGPIASVLLKKLGLPLGAGKLSYTLVTPTQQTESYNLFKPSEIYHVAASVIDQGATIGLITTRNSQEHFLFGQHSTNRVLPLIPSDPDLLTKKNQCQFIVIEPNAKVLSISSDMLENFTPDHSIQDESSHTLLEIWIRNPH